MIQIRREGDYKRKEAAKRKKNVLDHTKGVRIEWTKSLNWELFDFYYKEFAIPKMDVPQKLSIGNKDWIGLDWLGLWEENWNHKFILF